MMHPPAASAYLGVAHQILTGDFVGKSASEMDEEDHIHKVSIHSRSSEAVVPKSSAANKVAVIPYKEVVQKYGGWCSMGTEELANRIRQAAYDNSIAAIILDFDTPGGAADAVQNPSAAIREAKSRKPVIGYAGNGMVASAGYWMMSYADEIYAEYESDEIGSIGTYVTMINYEKFLASSYKTDVQVVYATNSTEKNKGYRDAFGGGENATEWLVTKELDPFNDMFMNTVRENRKSVNEDALKGRLFMANEAFEMGLIDGIKSFQEVVDRAFELADNFESQTTSSMKKGIFGLGKETKLEAALNATSEERTPEMMTAANAEISESGLQLVSATEMTESQNTIASLQAEVKTLRDAQCAAATAAGLTVAEDGAITGADGKPSTIEAAVTSIVSQNNELTAENKTLRDAAAGTSTSTTTKEEEAAASSKPNAEVAAMYDDIESKY